MCGVFGIYSTLESSQLNIPQAIYLGLQALQHRGQEAAGIATVEKNGEINVHRQQGLVNTIFNPTILNKLKGNVGVGHTRYSTTGSEEYLQPTIEENNDHIGNMALAHNGNLINTESLKWEFKNYAKASDSWLLSKFIKQKSKQKGYALGIETALMNVEGAFSIVHASKNMLIAARDTFGFRPLVIGTIGKPIEGLSCDEYSTYVIASETCALDIVGAKFLREVKPGELIKIDKFGIRSYDMNLIIKKPKKCIFEDVYFSRPDSRIEKGETIYSTRKRLGMYLATEDKMKASNIDLVVGVPDSGIPGGIGYALEKGVNYGEAFIKNRYVGRTFIQPIQALRESDLHVKLNVLTDVVKDKRLVVIDDSIVRGTTTRKLVKMLRDAGAKEVHLRITAPPVKFSCMYGVDTPDQDKLIAYSKNSVEEIRKHIGADSLCYISLNNMKKATGREGFCDACFTGDYPHKHINN